VVEEVRHIFVDPSSCQETRSGSHSLFPVVYEHSGLLVINKPADLVCHPTKGDAYSSLISRVRLYLGEPSTPQLINRLDRETSGLVLVGKDATTTLEIRRVWESRAVEKTYAGLVHGWPAADHGIITAPLGKDLASPVAIKDTVREDGAPAETEYWVERRFEREGGRFAVLRIRPHTGRKHQIRIHLAWSGHPLVGDKLYGPDERLYLAFVEGRLTEEDRRRLILPYHALHARSVRFHWRGLWREFCAPPERWFLEFIPDSVV
jgi:23S rRNA pseudouridine1911/1915/1917 synthase